MFYFWIWTFNQESRFKFNIDYYSFCSNWFPMHPEFEKLKINYYCAYDDNFVSPDVNEQWYSMIKHINCIFFPNAMEQNLV